MADSESPTTCLFFYCITLLVVAKVKQVVRRSRWAACFFFLINLSFLFGGVNVARDRIIRRIDQFVVGDRVELLAGQGGEYEVSGLDAVKGVVRLADTKGDVRTWFREHWRGKFRRIVAYADEGVLPSGRWWIGFSDDRQRWQVCDVFSDDRVVAECGEQSDAELVVRGLGELGDLFPVCGRYGE